MVRLIHLHIVCGCSHATIAEFSSCGRDDMWSAKSKIYIFTCKIGQQNRWLIANKNAFCGCPLLWVLITITDTPSWELTLTDDCGKCVQRLAPYPQGVSSNAWCLSDPSASLGIRLKLVFSWKHIPAPLAPCPSLLPSCPFPESTLPVNHFNKNPSLRPCFRGIWLRQYSLMAKGALSQVVFFLESFNN